MSNRAFSTVIMVIAPGAARPDGPIVHRLSHVLLSIATPTFALHFHPFVSITHTLFTAPSAERSNQSAAFARTQMLMHWMLTISYKDAKTIDRDNRHQIPPIPNTRQ